jgi:hypothetical protein
VQRRATPGEGTVADQLLEHAITAKPYESVWVAIEDTPGAAENMKILVLAEATQVS